MKTLFIPAFQGVSGRIMFRTGVFAALKKIPDLRIVIFVPTEGKKEYYEKEFGLVAPNPPAGGEGGAQTVIFEVLPDWRPTALEKFLGASKFYALNSKTTVLRRKMKLSESKNYFEYFGGRVLDFLCANALARALFRFLDERIVKNNAFAPVFEKYKPTLVFSGNPFDDLETAFLREAKQRNIPVLATATSWDKLTARALMRLLPDIFLVPNEITKREAIKYHSVPDGRIKIVGTPQYDFYKGSPRPKEVFLEKIGAKADQKILVYCPMGKTYSDSDYDMIKLLLSMRENGEIPENVFILVRMQPNDPLAKEKIPPRENLYVDTPGIRFGGERGVDWDMTEEDLLHLRDTLAYANLLICYASSISIDAAIFDVPVINIGFELERPRLLSKSPTHFYRMEHYKHLLDTKGVAMPKSKEELARSINEYLANRKKDSGARAQIVREQSGGFTLSSLAVSSSNSSNGSDGSAGGRVVDEIGKFLR